MPRLVVGLLLVEDAPEREAGLVPHLRRDGPRGDDDLAEVPRRRVVLVARQAIDRERVSRVEGVRAAPLRERRHPLPSPLVEAMADVGERLEVLDEV